MPVNYLQPAQGVSLVCWANAVSASLVLWLLIGLSMRLL